MPWSATELSARELAWHFTDERRYFLSESSVYRILKAYDLITSPAYVLLSASDRFAQPSRRTCTNSGRPTSPTCG